MIYGHPVKRMAWRGLLIEVVTRLNPDCYVELGIRKSHTFNGIAPLVPKAIAVDQNPGVIKSMQQSSNVELYLMNTVEFVQIWKDPIDVLFIDAEHTERAVTADFEGCLPYIREGTGLIFLHDSHPVVNVAFRNSGEVWRLARNIHRLDKYRDLEIVTLPGPCGGMSIVRKAPKHLYHTRAEPKHRMHQANKECLFHLIAGRPVPKILADTKNIFHTQEDSGS